MKTQDLVTLRIEDSASNVFLVDTVETQTDTVLLTHPLSKKILIRANASDLNSVNANIKDSTERALDFANDNRKYLDFNTNKDIDGLCMFFVVERKLTPRQKQVLSSICGIIASVKFNNDVKKAMDFVTGNVSLLDDFNLMWFNNFKGLFTGRQPITSQKQRSSIFNIAGYIYAEQKTQSTNPLR